MRNEYQFDVSQSVTHHSHCVFCLMMIEEHIDVLVKLVFFLFPFEVKLSELLHWK